MFDLLDLTNKFSMNQLMILLMMRNLGGRRKNGNTKKRADYAAIDKKPAPVKAGPPSPSRPICQGNWMKIQSYRGWHPEHGYGGPPGVLRECYQHRDTGETQNERPDCWDSDGSFHSKTQPHH